MTRRHTISMTWPQYLRRECSYDRKITRLSPTEAELLLCLLLRRGRVTSKNDLIEMVWNLPDAEPDWAASIVAVMLSKLRVKLPGILANVHGRGWIIEKVPRFRWSNGRMIHVE